MTAMQRNEIEAKINAWRVRRHNLWSEIINSFSQEQKKLYYRYVRAGKMVELGKKHLHRLNNKVAKWQQYPNPLLWPDEENTSEEE